MAIPLMVLKELVTATLIYDLTEGSFFHNCGPPDFRDSLQEGIRKSGGDFLLMTTISVIVCFSPLFFV